ncbi:MAG: hypothetical protein A2135_10375 [Actinobacteria bacterium RBG_16_67_15]|nr:MAG: hypothetical protein A2135_10375 [Actinobacteria bacterium RBG_16_67_15]
MSKRLNRLLTVLVLAVFVAAGWSMVGHSAWAAARQYLGAGLEFDSWMDPLVAMGGMVLVTVTATRLIERSRRALFPKSVGPSRARVGYRRPVSGQLSTDS